jgi:hybrid polyketide synthase/nonribosomal peptide synthetase ACE1
MQEVHGINAASDFFYVGGNSMLLIELRQLLNETFQTSLPLMKLFENSTLGAMATMLQNDTSGSATAIDWEAETAVPRTVVMSGATGLLGSSLHHAGDQVLPVQSIRAAVWGRCP